MSYESKAEPIKLGYLMDFRLPPFYPQEMRDDLTRPFDLVFGEGLARAGIRVCPCPEHIAGMRGCGMHHDRPGHAEACDAKSDRG